MQRIILPGARPGAGNYDPRAGAIRRKRLKGCDMMTQALRGVA